MKLTTLLATILCGSLVFAQPPRAAQPQSGVTINQPLATIASLTAQARQRVNAKPRLELASETAELFSGLESFEAAGSNRVPNYLRALAVMPQAIKPLANSFRTFLYGGTIAPEIKLAMALRIAQVNHSPYVAAHTRRLLLANARGAEMLDCLQADQLSKMKPAEQRAIRYAELLTRNAHGITDAEFQATKSLFNDSQLVELTMLVCFFNYFTRYCEALNLPVESWALEGQSKPILPTQKQSVLTQARIALVSDEEMAAAIATDAAARNPSAQAGGLSIGIANSQRAMMRVPDIQAAWRRQSTAVRANSKVGREMLLQVSFAVSMANGCRYCIVHQVVGLRRQGVDPAKLQAMQKDDPSLTPRELVAVTFARKLTRDPAAITDADFAALHREFQEYGALEILLQTCAFNFMNRFTDNLRLPSEDEAIHLYQEVYGAKPH